MCFPAYIPLLCLTAPYQLGGDYSVADAYLYTLLRWLKWFGFGLERWPSLQRFQELIALRPATIEALAAELSGAAESSH